MSDKKKKNIYRNKLEYSYYNRFLNYIKWNITKYPFKSSNKLVLDLFYKFKDTIILRETGFIKEYENVIKNKNNYNNLLKDILEIYIGIANNIIQDYNNKNDSKNFNSYKNYYYGNYKFRKNDINKIKEAVDIYNDYFFQEKLNLYCNDKNKIRYYIEKYKERFKKDNYIITNLYKKWFNISDIEKVLSQYNNENGINKYENIVNNEYNIYEKNKLKEKILKYYMNYHHLY